MRGLGIGDWGLGIEDWRLGSMFHLPIRGRNFRVPLSLLYYIG